MKIRNRSLAHALLIVGIFYAISLSITYHEYKNLSFIPWPLGDIGTGRFALGTY
jgi:hypothetical protein